MKLATIQSALTNANNMRDILQKFEDLGYDFCCDYLDNDTAGYIVDTPDGEQIYLRYNFEIGACYISTDEEEDKELILQFSITKTYISD